MFVDSRRRGLELFLNRLARHAAHANSEDLVRALAGRRRLARARAHPALASGCSCTEARTSQTCATAPSRKWCVRCAAGAVGARERGARAQDEEDKPTPSSAGASLWGTLSSIGAAVSESVQVRCARVLCCVHYAQCTRAACRRCRAGARARSARRARTTSRASPSTRTQTRCVALLRVARPCAPCARGACSVGLAAPCVGERGPQERGSLDEEDQRCARSRARAASVTAPAWLACACVCVCADIANAWFDFGFSCTLLGQFETEQDEQHLGNAFAKLGNCADRLSVLITQKVDTQVVHFQEPFDDFLRQIDAVKEMLKGRTAALVRYQGALTALEGKQARARAAPSRAWRRPSPCGRARAGHAEQVPGAAGQGGQGAGRGAGGGRGARPARAPGRRTHAPPRART